MGLHKVFAKTAFARFNGILKTAERKSKEQTFPNYEFICHQVEFCESVRQDYRRFLSIGVKPEQGGIPLAKRSQVIQRMEEEWESLINDWNFVFNISFSPRFIPLEFVYDPAKRKIIIQSITEVSVDPAKYPDRVKTTSELLRFIVSLDRAVVAYLGDVDWYQENYPLLKLIVDVLDTGGFRWDCIRINVDDYEEWDYMNAKFDLEVARYKTRKGSKDA